MDTVIPRTIKLLRGQTAVIESTLSFSSIADGYATFHITDVESATVTFRKDSGGVAIEVIGDVLVAGAQVTTVSEGVYSCRVVLASPFDSTATYYWAFSDGVSEV